MTPAANDESADALNCPLCGYDLRGLPEHRCPECGHAFDPSALRDAQRSRPAWSFEHATSRRWRAFLETCGRSLLPWRFWRELSPAHPVVPRRLAIWTAVWFGVGLPLAFGGFVLQIGATYANLAERITGRIAPSWSVVIPVAYRVMRDERALMSVKVATLAWPFVTLLALAIFGITLRRAGIRPGHLWRCVVYAWPATLLVAFAGHVAIEYLGWTPRVDRAGPLGLFFSTLRLTSGAGLTFLACATVSTLHLAFAHARYLRLPHAAGQALLVGLVTWLALATLIASAPR